MRVFSFAIGTDLAPFSSPFSIFLNKKTVKHAWDDIYPVATQINSFRCLGFKHEYSLFRYVENYWLPFAFALNSPFARPVLLRHTNPKLSENPIVEVLLCLNGLFNFFHHSTREEGLSTYFTKFARKKMQNRRPNLMQALDFSGLM